MNVTKTAASQHSKTYEMTVTALMTAVTCILAPLSIPIGPVPISFTNLAIYLSLYLLGWKRGTISYLVYLLIGLVGVPVFSGFTGGIGKLAGPTGGYIIGFIAMAVIAGLVIDKCHNRWLQLLGILLDRTGLSQVGKHRSVIRSLLYCTAQLRKCKHRNLKLSGNLF